jgi:hypothetical protein
MKHLIIGVSRAVVSVGFLVPTLVAYAEGQGNGAGCLPGQLCNPLKFDNITDFLIAIIDVLLIFALPLIILAIMYAGFMFVTAQGDTSKVSKARAALTWAVVGGVIALSAKLIIEVLKGTIDAFTNG